MRVYISTFRVSSGVFLEAADSTGSNEALHRPEILNCKPISDHEILQHQCFLFKEGYFSSLNLYTLCSISPRLSQRTL